MTNSDIRQTEPQYRVNDLIIDPNNRTFKRDGKVTTLPKLSFKFLHCLIRHAPDTVDFDQLNEEVWGQTIVSPETLTQRAKLLRDAIGDDHQNPRYIETKRGHGYRLIPAVEPLARSSKAQTKPKSLLFASLGLVAVIWGLVYSLNAGRIEEAGDVPPSIAVLPFANLSADPEQDYFSDGLSEELINLLSKIPGLHVSARTSSFSFKGQRVDIPAIAEKLRVSHVIEGSVRKAGDELRITVQLVKADDGYHLWSETYDRTLDDVFVVQNDIATSIVGALKITLFEDPLSPQETSMDAYTFYLKARYFDNIKGEENWEKAVHNYQRALAIDPDYAPAWAGLSVTYRYQANANVADFDASLDLAREAAEKALSLDENLAVAWSNLGQIEILDTWDLTAAERAMQKALQLEPSNAEVLNHAATLQYVKGDVDEAIAQLQQSIALDPVSQSTHNALGLMYMYAGRLDEAETVFRQLLELNPQYPWGLKNLGRLLLLKGEPKAALDSFRKSNDDQWRASGIVMALGDLGRHDEARAALTALEQDYAEGASYQIAAVHAWRGDIDLAFDWLQRSYQRRETGVLFVAKDPFYNSLHEDPRWAEFLDSLGLTSSNSSAYGI